MRPYGVAMIRGEDDQRVIRLSGLIQRLEHAADLRVQLLGIRIVVRAALAVVLFSDLPPGLGLAAVKPGLVLEAVGEAPGDGDGARVVAVQVVLQRHVGIVRLDILHFEVPGLGALGEAAQHPYGAVGPVGLRCGLFGALAITPHDERLAAGPREHAALGDFQPLLGTLHFVRVEVEFPEGAGVAAGDVGQVLKPEIRGSPNPGTVPFADVAEAIAGLAQPLGIQNDIGVEIPFHGRRGVDLVVDAVVPVIRAGESHGPRRAADGGRRVRTLEQHALRRKVVQVGRSRLRAARDGGPLLLVGLNVEDVGPLARLRTRGGGSGGGQEFSPVDHTQRSSTTRPAEVQSSLRTRSGGR